MIIAVKKLNHKRHHLLCASCFKLNSKVIFINRHEIMTLCWLKPFRKFIFLLGMVSHASNPSLLKADLGKTMKHCLKGYRHIAHW